MQGMASQRLLINIFTAKSNLLRNNSSLVTSIIDSYLQIISTCIALLRLGIATVVVE